MNGNTASAPNIPLNGSDVPRPGPFRRLLMNGPLVVGMLIWGVSLLCPWARSPDGCDSGIFALLNSPLGLCDVFLVAALCFYLAFHPRCTVVFLALKVVFSIASALFVLPIIAVWYRLAPLCYIGYFAWLFGTIPLFVAMRRIWRESPPPTSGPEIRAPRAIDLNTLTSLIEKEDHRDITDHNDADGS